MDAACVQQAVSEGKTLRAVVIAADEQHRDAALCKRNEKPVKQCDCLAGRDALVVYIACDHDRIRALYVCDFQNLMQDIVLIVQHGDLIDPLAEMQIRQMKKLHEIPPTNQRYHNCTGFPAKEQ